MLEIWRTRAAAGLNFKHKSTKETSAEQPEHVSAYTEDSVLGFWCENQVEALAVGEGPVKNQQHLIFWVVLSGKNNVEMITKTQIWLTGGKKMVGFELILGTTRKTGTAIICGKGISDGKLKLYGLETRKRNHDTHKVWAESQIRKALLCIRIFCQVFCQSCMFF